jgi:prepilin-type N-terminal cleavage/methylation domain-containing protein
MIQTYHFALKKAFSMVELIFVIVILGIVSTIGAEIIAKMYENYIIQTLHHRASLKIKLASIQIEHYLNNAVVHTIQTDSRLQWVGSDMDSFNAYTSKKHIAGWSGFCDINKWHNSNNKTEIPTPFSNLNLTNEIIHNLGGDITKASLYFLSKPTPTMYDIKSTSKKSITLKTTPDFVVEHYALAWSSYAIVLNNKNLILYYNFPPRINASIIKASSQILLKNVSSFSFYKKNNTLEFKICIDEKIDKKNHIDICKQKVIF